MVKITIHLTEINTMKTQHYIDQTQNEIESTQQYISDIQTQIDQLKLQMAEFEQKMRVIKQLETAQETAQQELQTWLYSFVEEGKKIIKDACAVFPETFLDDIQQEINEQFNEIKTEIKDNYDKYAKSDRFLNAETQQQQDKDEESQQLLLTDALPENPSEILSENQIQQVISPLEEPQINFIRNKLSISNRIKKINSLCKAIANKKVSYQQLLNYIELFKIEQAMNRSNNNNLKLISN